MKPLSVETRAEWRAHWKLVLAAAVGASMMSIATTSVGAYMAPLEQEFGWTRAQVSSGVTVFAVAGVLIAPLLGSVVDRWGPRPFGVPGVILCGAAFALFGTATSSILYWILLWFVYSAVGQVSRPLVWSAAVSSEFKASRGTALAFMMAGSGIGNVVAPVLAGYLIDGFGWRQAYVVMGLGWGGFSGLICYLYFYGRSDRLRGTVVNAKDASVILPGVSAREGFMSMTFAKFAGATLLGHLVIMALWVHLIPLLASKGVPRANALWLGGLVGLAATLGQLLSGALADRFRGNVLSAGYLCFLVIACLSFFIPSESTAMRMIPVIVLGIFGGAQTHILPYLATRYFGLRAFGRIFGVVASVMGIAVGFGPLIAGYIYDLTHSYDMLLLGSIPVAIMAALLVLSLGRYPDHSATVSHEKGASFANV